jgi:hypothetical protein
MGDVAYADPPVSMVYTFLSAGFGDADMIVYESRQADAGQYTPVAIQALTVVQGCRAGGQRISVGVDTNRNSVLDSDEVQSRKDVCNGISAPSIVTNSVDPAEAEDHLFYSELLAVEEAHYKVAPNIQFFVPTELGSSEPLNASIGWAVLNPDDEVFDNGMMVNAIYWGSLDPQLAYRGLYAFRTGDGSAIAWQRLQIIDIVADNTEFLDFYAYKDGRQLAKETWYNDVPTVADFGPLDYWFFSPAFSDADMIVIDAIEVGSGETRSPLWFTGVTVMQGCRAGGERVSVGFDADGDGTLDEAEATSVMTMCNGVSAQVAAPVLSHPEGAYAHQVTVTISDATPNASIYYTLDGSAPYPSNGTRYTEPVRLTQSQTLHVRAFLEGHYDSLITSASYTIFYP